MWTLAPEDGDDSEEGVLDSAIGIEEIESIINKRGRIDEKITLLLVGIALYSGEMETEME